MLQLDKQRVHHPPEVAIRRLQLLQTHAETPASENVELFFGTRIISLHAGSIIVPRRRRRGGAKVEVLLAGGLG